MNISIETVGSGIPLLNIDVNSSNTIKELYELIRDKLNKKNAIILFKGHNYKDINILQKSDKLIKDEGLEDGSVLTLFNKFYTEREILEILYNETDGPNWGNNTNWCSNKDISEWYGIETFNKDRHFCIFDELYSGTNPYEAVASAQAFLSHLSQQKNVSFMITTHYIELCNKLSEPNTKNYNMNIIKKTDSIEYTYLLREGISNIKGGVHVLEQLNYPENIISKTKENLSNSFIPG